MDYIFYTYVGARAKGIMTGKNEKCMLKPNMPFGLAPTKGGFSLCVFNEKRDTVSVVGVTETTATGLTERASKTGKRVPKLFKGYDIGFVASVRKPKSPPKPIKLTVPTSKEEFDNLVANPGITPKLLTDICTQSGDYTSMKKYKCGVYASDPRDELTGVFAISKTSFIKFKPLRNVIVINFADREFVAVSFQEAGRGESLQVLKEKIAQLKLKGLGPWASSIAKVLANVTDAIYMGADKYQQNFDNKQFKQGYSFSVNSLAGLLNDNGINAESDARSQTVRIVNKTTDFDVVISLLIDNDLISRATAEMPVVIRSSTVVNGKASTKKLGSFVLDLSSETSRGKAATSSILRRADLLSSEVDSIVETLAEAVTLIAKVYNK